MLGAITVAALLILITVFIIDKDLKIANNSNSNLNKRPEIFNLNSYDCEYELQVISNKNQNKYVIKEWYQNLGDGLENFRYETKNDSGDRIEYNISNNSVSIKADNQKLEYSLNDYILKEKNLMSISTFLSLYKKIEDNLTENKNDLFKLESKIYDDKEYYDIIINKNSNQNEDNDLKMFEEYQGILKYGINVSKLELVLDKTSKKPIEYIIYDKDDKVFMDITYIFFNINVDFSQKVFAFFDK
jgi:hypothetical protein